jgi:hypothetical protein
MKDGWKVAVLYISHYPFHQYCPSFVQNAVDTFTWKQRRDSFDESAIDHVSPFHKFVHLFYSGILNMASVLNNSFLVLFLLLLVGLGVANFVETKNEQDQTLGRPFFALLFLVMAIGLGVYKFGNP